MNKTDQTQKAKEQRKPKVTDEEKQFIKRFGLKRSDLAYRNTTFLTA